MAIEKAKYSNKARETKNTVKPASDESMEKLVRVMTDAPSLVKLADAGWEVRALKPAVQWEIAKVACEIHQVENASYGDILTEFAKNLPAVVRVITLALLNDKKRIEEEYDLVYDTLMWESNPSEWANVLLEILNLQDIGFFLQITQVTEIFRQMTLQKRRTMAGQ
ncbi:MAG: hypothetical protein UH850_00385 [Paludibacteraceae bacterium]|nr:hypothetical protein [Paludibacteraceae bacterium]